MSIAYSLDHLATFHDEDHLLHALHVSDRVAIDGDHIGELSSFDVADLVRQSQQFRTTHGRCLQSPDWCHSPVD